MNRNELVNYLNDLLEIDNFKDYGPNGLQVEGKEEIQKVAFAVSATIDSVEKACDWGADALIAHHGLFWRFHGPKTITGAFAGRVKPLVQNEINLLGYHLPLDAHIKYGNAAGIASALGIKKLEPFGEHMGAPLGVSGKLPSQMSGDELKEKLADILKHDVIHAALNPNEQVSSIGIITGGANNEWPMAQAAGLDCYLTGEISEYNWHEASEAGIHYFAGGHHATERFGVLSLMELVKSKFKLETTFIDSTNPV